MEKDPTMITENERIEAQELICEIKEALRDTFVATVLNAEHGLLMRFGNGQLFRLYVEAA